MNEISKITLDMQLAVQKVTKLHRATRREGVVVCTCCATAWPCDTRHAVEYADSNLLEHIDGVMDPLTIRTNLLGDALHALDASFSLSGLPAADTIVSQLHELCITDGVRVRGALNGVFGWELQIETRLEDGSFTRVWSLILGSSIAIRVFTPTPATAGANFFENLVGLAFATSQTDELVEWWSTQASDCTSYLTVALGDDWKTRCDVIGRLCEATVSVADRQPLCWEDDLDDEW